MISVAVIGGGASGMAFAVALKQKRPDIEVTVFEKNPKVLKKILVTGNGRCNILMQSPRITLRHANLCARR